MLYEVITGRYELGRRVVALGEQHPVLHVPVLGDDDEQHAPFRQPDEFDVAEGGGAAPGRHHDAREVRELREQLGRGLDGALRVVRQQVVLQLVQGARVDP